MVQDKGTPPRDTTATLAINIQSKLNKTGHELFISYISAGPLYLTVSSEGGAGELWYPDMGVYSQTGHYHNNKMVWAKHDGTRKIFYSKCKSICFVREGLIIFLPDKVLTSPERVHT